MENKIAILESRIGQLESEKAELINFLIKIKTVKYFNDSKYINREFDGLLERMTGKKIEDVL